MPYYMVFRAVTPPNFDFESYQKHSSDPIKFDSVTVVQADTPDDAINALIGSTGMIVTSFAAVEVSLRTFQSDTSLGSGGVLVAPSTPQLANGEPAADTPASPPVTPPQSPPGT